MCLLKVAFDHGEDWIWLELGHGGYQTAALTFHLNGQVTMTGLRGAIEGRRHKQVSWRSLDLTLDVFSLRLSNVFWRLPGREAPEENNIYKVLCHNWYLHKLWHSTADTGRELTREAREFCACVYNYLEGSRFSVKSARLSAKERRLTDMPPRCKIFVMIF